jgi:hypothetical protein
VSEYVLEYVNSRKIRPDWIIQETVETGQKEKEAVEESVKL